VRSIIWPEIFHGIDYILRSWARAVYTKEPGLSDRAIERPFVFLNLPPHGRVLDVGCTGSDLPLVLRGFGYEVVGLDTRLYQLAEPLFEFVRGDIRNTSFPDGRFDLVLAVSTIEHIGLSGRYGSDEDAEGDVRAMREIHSITRSGGKVLLTVPYGEPAIFRPWNRVYGPNELRNLVDGFNVVKAEFFAPDEMGIFKNVEERTASNYRASANVISGKLLDYSYPLACLVLERP